MELSELDRSILDFERISATAPGRKSDAIKAVLGISSGAYYRLLRELIPTDIAYAYDPLLIKRLRRRVDQRRRERYEGRSGDGTGR